MVLSSSAFAIAFLVSLIPALFWLWFWLREDKQKPEPLLLVIATFVAGMLVVPATLPLQRLAIDLYSGDNLIVVWVVIEEILKYVAALLVILWNQVVDEPIDYIIYMITIALGFATLENTLFATNALSQNAYSEALINGSLRFIGATLLHVLASATVGVFMAFAFYRSKTRKVIYGTFGLFIAILLHALFNFFIMDASGGGILTIFLFVWMGVIVLFLLFEKVKLLELSGSTLSRKKNV